MKRISAALLTGFFMLTLFSCKKDGVNDPVQPAPSDPTGEVTPVGTPEADPAISKTIGAAGGSIVSNDGRIKIIIPAGALTSDQQISIQSISNHNPLGLKQAFRLMPHNVQFNKAVSVQFRYNDDDVAHTIPEALGVAYQDSKGIWQARGGMVLDKTNKTVTVITTHFSDWSLFESISLFIKQPVVPVNGTTELEVFTTDDLLVPLDAGKEVPIGKKQPVAAKYVQEWKLNGAGVLSSNGALANYKAPANIPANNPVTVTIKLDLKQRGLFLLVGAIEITNDDGEIEIRVAGSGWLKKTASGATKFSDGSFSVADSDGDVTGSYVFIRWVGGVGFHPYKDPEALKGTHMQYLVTGVNNYTCAYVSGDKLVASGGGVTITSMGEDDGFIKGTFTVDPAGCGDKLLQTTSIEGKFRVKKYW